MHNGGCRCSIVKRSVSRPDRVQIRKTHCSGTKRNPSPSRAIYPIPGKSKCAPAIRSLSFVTFFSKASRVDTAWGRELSASTRLREQPVGSTARERCLPRKGVALLRIPAGTHYDPECGPEGEPLSALAQQVPDHEMARFSSAWAGQPSLWVTPIRDDFVTDSIRLHRQVSRRSLPREAASAHWGKRLLHQPFPGLRYGQDEDVSGELIRSLQAALQPHKESQ